MATTSGAKEKLICPFCYGERCGKSRCSKCGMQTRGDDLIKKWNIDVEQAMFNRTGSWFHIPKKFPAALTSPSGFIRFDTLQDLKSHPNVSVKQDVNLKGVTSISGIKGFVIANLEPIGSVVEKEAKGPEGFVYGITNPAFPNWVKVGKAYDADERLQSYQTGDPHRSYNMPIRHRVANRSMAEKKAHEELKKITTHWRGEWFKLSTEEVEEVISRI